MWVSLQETRRLRKQIITGLVLTVVVSLAATVSAFAIGTPQEMYVAAMAREQAIRVAMADADAPAAVGDVRAVIAAYQEIVRSYPTSGYSDDALWQGGHLAIDAFVRFGEERDKNTGLRLLRLLTTEYPASKHVREVPEQLARVDGRESSAAKGPLPQTPPAGPDPGTAAKANPTARPATIKNIRREVLADAVRITIELDREVSFHDELIEGPVRVFVDLPSTRAAPALVDKTLRFDGDADIVRQVRIGRHPNTMTRVVLDAAGVSSYSVYPLYDPYRLVIDCVRTPVPALATAANSGSALPSRAPVVPAGGPVTAPGASAVMTSGSYKDPPLKAVRTDTAGTSLQAVPNEQPAATPPRLPSKDVLPPIAPTATPLRNVGGGYSLARQLGLSVSRIVIDPGHGGHDPGAKGTSINEAELVLDIALRVEQLLEKMPGTEVILTRRTDEFVPLQERTAIANREGADLFLSIHANASPNPSARGIETYFLNFASNMTAASVAARENAASGQAMGALPDFLRAIALNNKLDESRDFATAVQTAMIDRLRKVNGGVKNLGVKQAPFVVLIGAAMPSVLAEISFVTNGPEAKLLRSSAYRQRIAEALASAIGKYQHSLKNVATVF